MDYASVTSPSVSDFCLLKLLCLGCHLVEFKIRIQPFAYFELQNILFWPINCKWNPRVFSLSPSWYLETTSSAGPRQQVMSKPWVILILILIRSISWRTFITDLKQLNDWFRTAVNTGSSARSPDTEVWRSQSHKCSLEETQTLF